MSFVLTPITKEEIETTFRENPKMALRLLYAAIGFTEAIEFAETMGQEIATNCPEKTELKNSIDAVMMFNTEWRGRS